jgi:chemotaxis signal transduction protein
VTGSLILRVGDRLLALPLADVVEVFRMVAVAARLPRAPRHCLGVVDCRGRLVPLFDLGGRLGITPLRSERELVDGHVVLVQDPVGEIGYAVDELRELSENPVEELSAGSSAPLGRLTLGAVRASDGRLAPILAHGSLLTVLARHQLRAALDEAARLEREDVR